MNENVNDIYSLLRGENKKFFSVLSSCNAEHYIHCMMTIRSMKNENWVYEDIEEEEVKERLERYFVSINSALEFDGEIISDAKEESVKTIRKLLDCGWLKRRNGEDEGRKYKRFIAMTFPASKILDSLEEISKGESVEYLSTLSIVLSVLDNKELRTSDRPYTNIIKPAYDQTGKLSKNLNQICDDLDEYIRIISDDKSSLADTLQQFQEAGSSEFDKLYREANATKYSVRIRRDLEDIKNDYELLQSMTHNYLETHIGESEERAFNVIVSQIDQINDFFESGYSETINKIIRRQKKYATIAAHRVKLLAQDDSDVVGMLNHLLKNISVICKDDALKDLTETFDLIGGKINLSKQIYIDEKSLKSPRKTLEQREICELADVSEFESDMEKQMQEEKISVFVDNQRHSRKTIENQVMEILEKNEVYFSRDWEVEALDDLLHLFYVAIYGLDDDSKYMIEFKDESVVNEHGYTFPLFSIKKRNQIKEINYNE